MPYFSDFTHREDGVLRLVRGDGAHTVSIAVRGERMLIVLTGEACASVVLDCLAGGLEEGWLRLSMRTLVDMSDFVGVVDWPALHKLRTLAKWTADGPGRSRVAYVVRSDAFHPIIRVITALFDHTQHRIFTDRQAAVAWLAESQAAPLRVVSV